jgi:hypothetical protein
MRKRLIFILCLSFIATVSAAAQSRTVTNSDLEKFRQKRLAAERDYRENYERLGFPSPEELEKQIEQSRRERSELSARLRAENLERERLDLERQLIEAEARRDNFQPQTDYFPEYQENGFSGYVPDGFYNNGKFGYRNNRFYRRNFRGNRRGTPTIDYRNNLPVIIQPPVYTTLSPGRGGKRN